MLIMDTLINVGGSATNIVWCCNNKGPMRRDFIAYSYPYIDKNTFTPEFLNARRDAVLGRVITASVSGSHMGTEYKVMPPQFRVLPTSNLQPNATYTAEIRGLWKMLDGEAMGGPYVSHTFLDSTRIVTAEVYVLAPGQKKRNALRQAEAILYTAQPVKTEQ